MGDYELKIKKPPSTTCSTNLVGLNVSEKVRKVLTVDCFGCNHYAGTTYIGADRKLNLILSQTIPAAYKHADGKKIDGRRVLVDVERGRTVKGWLPRRLGEREYLLSLL